MVKPKHIIPPNYSEADLICIDLSGTQLAFRLPMHEGSFEPTASESNIDIYDQFNKFPSQTERYARFITLIEQAWYYKSATSPFDAAQVIFSARISEASVEQSGSQLCQSAFMSSMLSAFESIFGQYDKDIEEEFELIGKPPTQEDMWVYPKSIQDFQSHQVNQTTWKICRVGHPGTPPLAFWVGTPLTPSHILILNFDFTGFQEKDIGPGICRDELMEAYVKDFLEHFHIQYSPETLAEMEQYK
ncbi:hypothetical protein O5O45_19530 [Hahella aquimaris]|uniref:hypothetical protein n=1 Tax=Hahella sp. HNIBRBA332 TaxID=3015983 RepID=UPI00273C9605|nr:hypothetical protein [Hahella sp. HNIBRBA332]WLQ11922.1 hypothetical protein O5O45_19530 [Hahella sp. HNIBRBA332]